MTVYQFRNTKHKSFDVFIYWKIIKLSLFYSWPPRYHGTMFKRKTLSANGFYFHAQVEKRMVVCNRLSLG